MIWPISFVGARCAGKSTAGRSLARALDLAFLDLDHLMLGLQADDQSGASASSAGELLVQLGEPAFRRLEARALRQAMDRPDPRWVLATGGGAVLDAGSRRILAEASTCIWLRCAPETLAKRMLADRQLRPSLTGAAPSEEIRQVLAQREALYGEVAAHVLDVDELSEQGVVCALIEVLDLL